MLCRPSGFQGMECVKCAAKVSDVCPVSFGSASFPRLCRHFQGPEPRHGVSRALPLLRGKLGEMRMILAFQRNILTHSFTFLLFWLSDKFPEINYTTTYSDPPSPKHSVTFFFPYSHIYITHAHTFTTDETNALTHKDFKQNRNLRMPTALKQTRLFGHRNQEKNIKFNRLAEQMSWYFLSEAVATKGFTQTQSPNPLPSVRFTPWTRSSSLSLACWVWGNVHCWGFVPRQAWNIEQYVYFHSIIHFYLFLPHSLISWKHSCKR